MDAPDPAEPAATPSAPTNPTPPPPPRMVADVLEEDAESMRAAAKARKPYRLVLEFPVRMGEDLVEEVTVRPLTVRELRGFPASKDQVTLDHYARALSQLIGRPSEFVDALAPADFNRAVLLIELFWQAVRTTGGVRSAPSPK